MLNNAEKTRKLIELQLGDLSEKSLNRLYKDMLDYIKAQKTLEKVQERIERENLLGKTYVQKEIVVNRGKKSVRETVITEVKTKRPRMQKLNVFINEDKKHQQQMEQLQKFASSVIKF